MKNAVILDVTPCGCCKNRHFGRTHRLHHQVEKINELGTTLAVTSSVLRLLVTADVPSSLIFVTLMMEVIRSSETSILTRLQSSERQLLGDPPLAVVVLPASCCSPTHIHYDFIGQRVER
jgi:hypothetical protein